MGVEEARYVFWKAEAGTVVGRNTDVCAVIVSFNRVDLLQQCLDSIEAGSEKPQSLVIFDNGSSDATLAMLLRRYHLAQTEHDTVDLLKVDIYRKPGVAVIHSPINLGGAGGFFTALKYAHEYLAGSDYYWLMDDDGSVGRDALRELKVSSAVDMIANSLVIDHDDDNRLAFGLAVDGVHCSTRQELNLAMSNPVVVNAINPFNGTFVGREVIERIGYPKPELFIWGDEVEYMYRAMKQGIELRTIVRAIHYHPAGRVETDQSRLFKFHVNKQQSRLRNYCDYRNRAYIIWQYERLGIVAHLGRYILFHLERLDFAGLMFFMRASLDGVCQNWGKERRLLD
jgi:GT2 family glycosyltransferase